MVNPTRGPSFVPGGLVGADVVRESEALRRRAERDGPTLNIPLALGETVLNFGRALVVSEPEAMVDRPGFFRRTSEYATSGSGGTFVPVPVAGYLYAGGSRDTRAKVESELRSSAPLAAVPTDAAAALALAPGETVAITRAGVTKMFAGNMKCTLDESSFDGSWLAGGPIAADVTVTLEGETTTKIVRGDDRRVTVQVLADTAKTIDGTIGAHVGVYLSWPGRVAWEVVRRLRDAEQTASEMASMPVWREHTSGAFAGMSRGKGQSIMAEMTLDLATVGGREAYAAAVRGDLQIARGLAERTNSGVTVENSYSTDIQRRAIPVSLGLFGFGVRWESSNERHETRGYLDGAPYTQTRDIETTERERTGLDLRTHRRTAQLDTISTRIRGRTEDKTQVGFTSTTSDPLTSREELLEEIDFVRALFGDRVPPSLLEYREVIAALADANFAGIGPSNEGGKTTATIDVLLPIGAPARLAALDEQKIYAAWADLTSADRPEWIDPAVRRRFDVQSTDGRLQFEELTPSYLDRRADYFAARQVVRTLRGLGDGTSARQNRALRDFVGTGTDRRPRLALVARLLDSAEVSVAFAIDSDRGPRGQLLDFSLREGPRPLPGAMP